MFSEGSVADCDDSQHVLTKNEPGTHRWPWIYVHIRRSASDQSPCNLWIIILNQMTLSRHGGSRILWLFFTYGLKPSQREVRWIRLSWSRYSQLHLVSRLHLPAIRPPNERVSVGAICLTYLCLADVCLGDRY
jgi:hypothetical protein